MNRKPATVKHRAGRLRRITVAVLLFVVTAFVLQVAVQPSLARSMSHGEQAMATADQTCAHSAPVQDKARSRAAEPGDSDDPGSSHRHDCCVQHCTLLVVLPAASSMDQPEADDVHSSTWSHRSGRTPHQILRPPRLSPLI